MNMKHRPTIYFLLPVLAVSFFLFTRETGATIYTFTDEEGIVHFTNVPTNPRYKPILRTMPSRTPARHEYQYEPHIFAAAREYNLDPNIIKAIIKAESNFDKNAISKKGAKGLMQLMPDTARDMNVNDIYDPRDNIFGGTRYFKKLFQIFDGDLKLALASYNAGLERVRYSRTIPDIKETRQYVQRVLKNYQHYQNIN